MANTGYKILVYKDVNPYSPTYNQTKNERVLDETACPNNAPNWIEISRTCNKITYNPSGVQGNNGQATITFQDQNIDSPTYNQTKTEIHADLTNCPLPDTTADYELQSSECEQI